MRIVYTLIMAQKFANYTDAGNYIDEQTDALMFNYRIFYVSSGLVIQVMDGSKNMGYL